MTPPMIGMFEFCRLENHNRSCSLATKLLLPLSLACRCVTILVNIGILHRDIYGRHIWILSSAKPMKITRKLSSLKPLTKLGRYGINILESQYAN